MSDTAKDWRMIADLLDANAARLPSPMRAREIVNECLAEADRLDRLDRLDDARVAWADYRKEYGVSERSMSAAHKAFLAGWDAATLAPFVRVEAEKPAPRSWPSLDQVPHDGPWMHKNGEICVHAPKKDWPYVVGKFNPFGDFVQHATECGVPEGFRPLVVEAPEVSA